MSGFPADFAAQDATGLSAMICAREISALKVAEATIAGIARHDSALGCFTAVTAERALAEAARTDRQLARGDAPGALAGVPVGVKNLFDITGLTTVAGSKILRERLPATQDAAAVEALTRAGATLCGALNMDEFAYGFVTENEHDGTTHNPHDRTRIAGGSSGGSAAAVAAGLLPLTLGSDTNGSIRVPASLCGVFGLKPTYGRVPRAGAYPFVNSLDHVGAFARSTRDLALAFDLLRCDGNATLPTLTRQGPALSVAVLGGYFARNAAPAALAAVEKAAGAFGESIPRAELSRADLARAAAYIITAVEGGQLHLSQLKERAADYDPATRDRLLAGSLAPAAWYVQAQRFRTWFRDRARELFAGGIDVLLAPATPCTAPEIGQKTMILDGREAPVRANLGLFTQPISFIGLPVVCAPTWPSGTPGVGLPIGVQIIAAPGRECHALQCAAKLEAAEIASAPIAVLG